MATVVVVVVVVVFCFVVVWLMCGSCVEVVWKLWLLLNGYIILKE